jgi:hypothetical protein
MSGHVEPPLPAVAMIWNENSTPNRINTPGIFKIPGVYI